MLQKEDTGDIKGQANITDKTILINSILQSQDTLPHEYAHHYIAMFRDAPIVKEAIKKWGSEEALVQAIGEQSVKQKGEAYGWWKEFSNWIKELFNKLNNKTKEELKNLLTDSFLIRQNLNKNTEPETINKQGSMKQDNNLVDGQEIDLFSEYTVKINGKDRHVTWNFKPQTNSDQTGPSIPVGETGDIKVVGKYKDSDMNYLVVEITDSNGVKHTTQPGSETPLHITLSVNKDNGIKPFMTGQHAKKGIYTKVDGNNYTGSVNVIKGKYNIKYDKTATTSKQGSSSQQDTLFNEAAGDIIVRDEQVDLAGDETLKNMYIKYMDEDKDIEKGGQVLGMRTVEFANAQEAIIGKMQDMFNNGSYSKINLKEINLSIDEQYRSINDGRATSGSIEHMTDRIPNIEISWNQANGTARKSETFLHEVIHFMTNRALKYRPDLKILLEEMKDQARNAGLTYEIFLEDIRLQGMEPTAIDIEIAQEKFDYTMSKEADPEEFFAYAITNEHLFNALKDIKIKPEVFEKFDTTKLNKGFEKTFKTFMNIMVDVINQVWLSVANKGGKQGSDLIVDTMFQLIEIQNQFDINEIETKDQDVDTFVDKMDEKLSPIITRFDQKVEDLADGIKKNSTLTKINKALEESAITGRIMQAHMFQNLVANVMMKTDNTKWSSLFALYRQGKNFIEKHRQGLSDAIEELVGKYFKDIDSQTRKAISSVIFNLDLPSLVDQEDGIELEGLGNILDSKTGLENLSIAYERKMRDAYKDVGYSDSFIKIQLKYGEALSKTLIYGGAFIENQQLNADNIYSRFYEAGKDGKNINPNTKRTKKDFKAIAALDRLITINALRDSPIQDRLIVKKYLESSKNVKDIKKMINMYKTFVLDSVDDLHVNNYNPVTKGFFEQLNTENLSFDLVPEDELDYYTGFFGRMKEVGLYGEIGGIKYYKLVGNEHTTSFDEGMFSIAGSTVPGIELKSILLNQLNAENKKRNKRDKVSVDTINNSVDAKMERFILSGGTDISIVNLPEGTSAVPIYDLSGSIINYKLDLNRHDKVKYMRTDTDVVKSAAYTFSKFKHRQASVLHNKTVVNALLKHHEKNVIDNPDDFIVLEKYIDGKFNEETHGRWNRIPDYTRSYILSVTGSHSIAIPKNMIELISGEKEVTLANFNVGPVDIRNNKKAQKIILALEDYIKEILGWMKETIAIRMGNVVAANAISNMIQAWVHGKVDPLEYIKRARRKWQELNEYRDLLKQLDLLKVEYVGQGSPEKGGLYNKIKILQQRIEKNPFDTLVQDGQFSPIIEDVNIQDGHTGHIAQMIEKAFNSNSVMKALKPIKEQIFMDKGTAVYNGMLKFTQYGDIITREILREKMEEDAIASGKPASSEDIQNYLNFLDQLFVNYGYIDNRYWRYLERVGGLFFTKYFFRQAKAMQSVIALNPARFGVELGAEALIVQTPTAEDAYYHIIKSAGYKIGAMNPVDRVEELVGDGLWGLPLFEIYPEWGKVFGNAGLLFNRG